MYRPEGWQATIKLDLEMPEVMAGQLADNDKIGHIFKKKRLFIILRYLRRLFFLFWRSMNKDKTLRSIIEAAKLYNEKFFR